MYDPIFMQHVTAVVQEDRARNSQRSRSGRSNTRISLVRQALSLRPRAMRARATSSRVSYRGTIPNRG